MSNIRRTERGADSELVEHIKVRLSKEQYDQLNVMARISNTYMSTIARKAIVKYLNDINN